MHPEIIAEWLRRQNYKVIKTQSSYWVELNARILQAFPFHWVINPDREELVEIWEKHRALGVRFSSPVNSTRGKLSYHVVSPNTSKGFSLGQIPKKARYDIRKGLRIFQIKQIDFSTMANEGWTVRVETLRRQARARAETKLWWENVCKSADKLPGFECWAAYSNGIMAAAAFVFRCDDYYTILYQHSRSEMLRLGVNNALAYIITSEMLSREGVKYVFYGLQSLDAKPSVDQFKFRMGFKALPIRQTVLLHPYFAHFVNLYSYAGLKFLKSRIPSTTLSKAEGLCRFFLDGNDAKDTKSMSELLDENREIVNANQ